MTPSLTELATSSATETSGDRNSGSGSGTDTDYERVDTSDAMWSKQFPATAVRGTAVAIDHRPDFERNDDGNWVPDHTTMDFGVVLSDPSLFTGEETFEGATVVHGADGDDDNRVYDANDESTEIDADANRVIFGSNSIFEGEVSEDGTFQTNDDGEIYLKVEGSAGKSVISTLDVKGRGGAHQIGAYNGEDVELHAGGFPEHSGHLFEYNPDDDAEEYQRVAGLDPELRPDVAGRDVIVMIQRQSKVNPEYDGNAYWATVFADVEDDRRDQLATQYAESFNDAHADDIEAGDVEAKEAEDFVTEVEDADGDGTTEFLMLQPTAEFERSQGNLIENGDIRWNTVDFDALNEARVEANFDELDTE